MTTEKQREAFKKELAQAEDWLYEDGEAQTGPVFRYAMPHALTGMPVMFWSDTFNSSMRGSLLATDCWLLA